MRLSARGGTRHVIARVMMARAGTQENGDENTLLPELLYAYLPIRAQLVRPIVGNAPMASLASEQSAAPCSGGTYHHHEARHLY